MALTVYGAEPPPRHPVLEKLLRVRKIVLLLAFAGAYFYAQYAFHPENMEVTRISEHSLMPGLVTPKFDRAGVTNQIYRQLVELAKPKTQQEFILETFSTYGLQAFSQKWKSAVKSIDLSGENVYGFIRGHRNDGAEAQLIVVQLGRSPQARKMIAHMLAFVEYAKEQVYWARDLVIVFVDGGAKESTEQGALALDAFLLKYQKIEAMTMSRQSVIADEVQSQTGALIAGVVYDMGGIMVTKGKHIVLMQTNGLNGQQVNLDVFNGIVKIAGSKYQSQIALYGNMHRHSATYTAYSPFTVPMMAVYTQAFTPIEGVHSVMGKYGVQGLTVGLSLGYSEVQTGQFIEEVSRMLNNVLERLHQSYFMCRYVLSDDMHFASVAFYMPVILILVSPLLVSAYFEWTNLASFQMPFLYLLFHCFGFVSYVVVTWIYVNVGSDFVVQWTKFPFVGVDGCDGQLTPPIPLIPVFILVLSAPAGLIAFWKWRVTSVGTVRMLCLLETSLIVGSLGLINFGLAVLTAALVVPIVFLMTFESSQKARCLFRTVALSILSPIGVITYLSLHVPEFFGVTTYKSRDSELGLAARLVRKLVEHDVLFGAHHLFLLCCAAYPIWSVLFASAMHRDPEEEEAEPEQPKRSKKSKK